MLVIPGANLAKADTLRLFSRAIALGLSTVVLCGSAEAAFQDTGTIVGGAKAAWGDYNNDGWVDLYTTNQLWRNNNGTLSVTPANLSGDGIWGDFDRDGLVDFFSYNTLSLRRNTGANFTAVALPDLGTMNSRGATWGDFNGDRYLDLYVGGYEWDGYLRDKILTNRRDGTFLITWTQSNDAQTTPGQPRPARGVTSADWDADGDLDIYVSNYRLEPNALWRNFGTGAFTDARTSHNAAATSPGYYGGHSIGAVFGDFNNDGLLDLFAGNFAHSGQPQSRFLKNRGTAFDYAFQDMGTGGVFYQESYASPTAGDIDNDGDLDLYFTTVYPTASGGVANYPILFRNDGNFNFTDVTTAWGLPKSGSIETYQAAFADYDNDGYLDLVTNGKLYRNTGGSNHWLKIRLDGGDLFDGTAVGAQVLIQVNGQTLVRQVESAVGEGNQNDPTLHFGLGSYNGPLTLQINWPKGITQQVSLAGVDQTLHIAGPTLGDCDLDGDVDLSDLGQLATHYSTASGANWAMGDFDFDGDVDLADLGTLASNYGLGPQQALADFQSRIVPEPSAVFLLLVTCFLDHSCHSRRHLHERRQPFLERSDHVQS